MILLDTHAFVWLASAPDKLSEEARAAIAGRPGEVCVSIVSAWEIALLVKKGRLHLPLPPVDFIDRALRHHGIVEVPLTREVIFEAVGLEPLHSDPFDRILVAEVLRSKGTLVSKDSEIAKYPGVRVAW